MPIKVSADLKMGPGGSWQNRCSSGISDRTDFLVATDQHVRVPIVSLHLCQTHRLHLRPNREQSFLFALLQYQNLEIKLPYALPLRPETKPPSNLASTVTSGGQSMGETLPSSHPSAFQQQQQTPSGTQPTPSTTAPAPSKTDNKGDD